MRYAQIRNMDISNGLELGASLFTQGCPFVPHCNGCHNREQWSFTGGYDYNEAVQNKILENVKPPHIKRLSNLGGEPLVEKNRFELSKLINLIKKERPNIKIWVYTGYTYEALNEEQEPYLNYILDNIDVLVDGPFIQEKKDLTLKFKGSSNQRLIDMQKTRKCGKIVLLNI